MGLVLPDGYLREYGGPGAPVVLVGDILGGQASWTRHAERLAPVWRTIGVTPLVVAYAAQGRLPPEGWGLALEGQALAEAMDGLDIARAHVAGWSLGGAIALELAMAHPERVRTLTLVEPQVRWLLRRLGREVAQERAEAEWFHTLADRPVTEEMLADFLRLAGVLAPGEAPQESRAWPLASANRLALASAWRVAAHEDDPKRVGRVTAPALLVRGQESTAVDRAMVQALGEILPQATALELPGRHASHLTATDAFLEALERLMEADAGAAPASQRSVS